MLWLRDAEWVYRVHCDNPRRWVIWPFLAPKEVRFASSEWDPLWSHGRGGRDKEIPHFFLVNGNPLQRILWLGTRLLRPYREKRQNRAAAAGAAWLRLPPPRAVQRDRGGSSTCFGAVCATQRPPHPAKPPKTWFLRPSTEGRLGARLHVCLLASESSAGTPPPQSTDFHTV